MSDTTFIISFPGAAAADGNRYASDLAVSLRDVDQEVKVEQRRDRSDTQDLGATLAVILGTASVTALAKGVANWLGRHSGARIQINADGSVIATDLDSRDAAKIAEAFAHRKYSGG